MAHVVHPQPGYPFSLSLSIEYSLSDAGLTVRTTATQRRRSRLPVRLRRPSVPDGRYGNGGHAGAADSRGHGAAVRRAQPADRLRAGRGHRLRLPHAALDGRVPCSTTPSPIWNGTPTERHASSWWQPPSDAVRTLWMDEAYPYVMVFSGDPLPDVARRALAVEPMLCPPNAFRSGESLVRLAPGESHTATW